ncbi:hypothetical protein ACFPIF_09580 [Brevundimonas faecalis]|uniref:hypothetical protein n=1 Tax=Brevundimonas faecalis TaxID=947378 RepID=UPI00361B2CD6
MTALAASLAVLATPIGAARAAVTDAFYDRVFVLAAHEKCGLFEPRLIAALDAAALQARGAALRAGSPATDLAAAAQRARSRAAGVACDDRDLGRVKARVQAGFAGWSRAARMTFPGDRSAWKGDRYESRLPGWRLVQDGATGGSPVRFGLVGRGPEATTPTAVVSFVGRPRPYAARLVLRDTDQSPRVWLAGNGLPPEPARRAVFASASRAAPTELLTEGARQGEAWIFPAQAAEALSRLDPRETFVIEFLFRDDSVASARFEAGDFAAARAFLAMGAA